MNENFKRYYFSVIKLCCIIILIVYFIYRNEKSLPVLSVEWFLLALTLAAALGFELSGSTVETSRKHLRLFTNSYQRNKLVLLCCEILLTCLLLGFFKESKTGLFLLPLVLLDIVVFIHLPFYCSLFSFVGILISQEDFLLYFFYCLFVIIIYFQNYIMIERYKKYLAEYEQEEYRLKDSIHSQDSLYKEELKKSSLAFENKMLEEKTRLSQALHDKLGHSINGSIYQLEASKILMSKAPEESTLIVQGVIDNLRGSMDEIRSLLRKEKPDKKRMALLQLIGLCEECKEKYGIEAEVKIEGENKEIAEKLWEIILDNTFEAVTNALKYANCTKLVIKISILHKVIRCSITDNGVGCKVIKEGMGIQGMMNRMRKVNGFLDIDSDHGFRINMIIPIEENQ